jgi:hypothetical protein
MLNQAVGITGQGIPGQGQASVAPRQSQVQEQVSRSAKVIERMEHKLASLYERLQPVLASAPSGENQKESKPTLVGHAQSLSNHNDQLEVLDSVLGDILDRLEL